MHRNQPKCRLMLKAKFYCKDADCLQMHLSEAHLLQSLTVDSKWLLTKRYYILARQIWRWKWLLMTQVHFQHARMMALIKYVHKEISLCNGPLDCSVTITHHIMIQWAIWMPTLPSLEATPAPQRTGIILRA